MYQTVLDFLKRMSSMISFFNISKHILYQNISTLKGNFSWMYEVSESLSGRILYETL